MQSQGCDLIGIRDTRWDRAWFKSTDWDGEEGEYLLHVRAVRMHGVLPWAPCPKSMAKSLWVRIIGQTNGGDIMME